eukprot:g10562.t1
MSDLNESNSSFQQLNFCSFRHQLLCGTNTNSCLPPHMFQLLWIFVSSCSAVTMDLTSNSSVWGSIEKLLSIKVQQGLFGYHLPAGGIDVEIVFANPQHGCDELMAPLFSPNTTAANDTSAYAGKIVMVRRGQCAFDVKGLNVDAVNGSAMVIYGCSAEPPEFCDATGLVTMISSRGSLVPSYYIPNAPGEALKDLVEAGNVLTAHIPGTGPIDPNDRIALQAIYDNMGGEDWHFQDAGLDEGLWGWDELANPSFDPCLKRIYGIICIDGRVDMVNALYFDATGEFPPEIKYLTAMTHLDFSANYLSGALPCELGQLENLQFMYLYQNEITEVTPCLGNLTNLLQLDLNHNSIEGAIPAEWTGMVKLVSLDLSYNKISSLPVLSSMPELSLLELSHNILTELPSFSQLTNLTYFGAVNNLLEGELDVTLFDGLDQLTEINMGNQNFHGPLPNLVGCTELVSIDFSHNKFSGSLPDPWKNLKKLKNLFLQHNALQSPVQVMSKMDSLETVDLSYNNLTSKTNNLAENGDASAFIFISLPNSIKKIDFSHNQIQGAWTSGWGGLTQKITHLLLSHNQIDSTLPDDFLSFKQMVRLDLSHNNLEGSVPVGSPYISLEKLQLDGNPNMHYDDLPYPDFVEPDENDWTKSKGASFSCPTFHGTLNTGLELTLDPSYYDHSLCLCEFGFTGKAPNCLPFPDKVDINNTLHTGFLTDGSATGRVRDGLDVSWVVTVAGPLDKKNKTLPVRAVKVWFAYVNFAKATNDLVEIFKGSNVLGERLSIFTNASKSFPGISTIASKSFPGISADDNNNTDNETETDVAPADALYVFSNVFTVRYASSASSGLHFILRYEATNTCPPGYQVLASVSAFCSLIPEPIEADPAWPPVVAAFLLAAVALLCITTSILVVLRNSLGELRTTSLTTNLLLVCSLATTVMTAIENFQMKEVPCGVSYMSRMIPPALFYPAVCVSLFYFHNVFQFNQRKAFIAKNATGMFQLEELNRFKNRFQWYTSLGWFLVGALPMVITAIVLLDTALPTGKNCELDEPAVWAAYGLFCVFGLGALILGLKLTEKEMDGLGFRKRLGWLVMLGSLSLCICLPLMFVYPDRHGPHYVSLIPPFWYVVSALFLPALRTFDIFKPIYNIPEDAMPLTDLLATSKGYKFFLYFCTSEFNQENALCYKNIMTYKSNTTQQGLRDIYGKYLTVDAPLSVNISHRLRVETGKAIDSVNDSTKMEDLQKILDPVAEELLLVMGTDIYGRFLNSDVYRKFRSGQKLEDVYDIDTSFSKSAAVSGMGAGVRSPYGHTRMEKGLEAGDDFFERESATESKSKGLPDPADEEVFVDATNHLDDGSTPNALELSPLNEVAPSSPDNNTRTLVPGLESAEFGMHVMSAVRSTSAESTDLSLPSPLINAIGSSSSGDLPAPP